MAHVCKKIAREISTIRRAPTLYASKSGYQYNWKIGLGFPTESCKLFGEISWLFKALICTGAGLGGDYQPEQSSEHWNFSINKYINK